MTRTTQFQRNYPETKSEQLGNQCVKMLKNNKVLDETEEQEEDNGSSYDEAPVSRSFLYSHMFSLRTILVINVVAVSVICVLSTGCKLFKAFIEELKLIQSMLSDWIWFLLFEYREECIDIQKVEF